MINSFDILCLIKTKIKRGIGKMLMQVQQSALAPMAVVANTTDASDNQTSNTSGTSLVNTTVNVHPGI